MCSISPDKNANDLDDDYSSMAPTDSDDNTFDHWQQSSEDNQRPTSDEHPYLRFHQPVAAIVKKASAGISVKYFLETDERRTITAIMNKIKNMLY